MATKPEIDFIEGPAPDTLVITDLVVGDGAEAVPGGRVEVHYVGVDFEKPMIEFFEVYMELCR